MRRWAFASNDSCTVGRPYSGGHVGHVIIWRHSRTAWNVEGRFQGHTDVPLDDVGLRQSQDAAGLLARSVNVGLVVSSDLRRATDTAAALVAITKMPLFTDPRLREAAVGCWEGMTGEEVRRRYPQQLAAWRAGEPVRRGGGELEDEVAQRAVAAFDAAVSRAPTGATVVIVTHGGVARILVSYLIGLRADQRQALAPLRNGNWAMLAPGHTGWRLVEYNRGVEPYAPLSFEF